MVIVLIGGIIQLKLSSELSLIDQIQNPMLYIAVGLYATASFLMDFLDKK